MKVFLMDLDKSPEPAAPDSKFTRFYKIKARGRPSRATDLHAFLKKKPGVKDPRAAQCF